MSHVIVTGGSGKLGSACVAELVAHGWDVTNLDQTPPRDPHLSRFVSADLSDFGQALEALTAVDEQYIGVDAVVHLAAIPRPGVTTNSATFSNNFISTYNVFSAARHVGIQNIVWASSESVLGLPFDHLPPYIPVDEAVTRPETTYSLGKFLEEQMAGVLCGRDPDLKMVALRLSNVMAPADYAQFSQWDTDPAQRRFNLWSYIDARDAAQAVRKSLEWTGAGFEAFIIANADTVSERPSAELVGTYYPAVPYTPTGGDHDVLLSIDKARHLLGFEPEHSWRTQKEE